MKELENLLYTEFEEFWYNIYNIEKEEIKALKKYIDYIEQTKREYCMITSDYNGIKNLFLKKHLDYLQKALSCILIEDYNGLACKLRIMIENYVCFYIIKKYKQKEIWKYWYLHGAYKAMKKIGNEPYHSRIKKGYEGLCDFLNISCDCFDDQRPYSWIKNAVKLKNYNFKDVCKLIDIKIYNDFEALSECLHDNNYLSKTRIVWMENLTYLIYILYEYTDKMLMEIDKRYVKRNKYCELKLELLNILNNCINYKEDIDIE